MKHEAVHNETGIKGFTMIPHDVYAWLLHEDLNRREQDLVLLIIRLTLGCNNREWAELRQADLVVIGIEASHAKEVINSVLNKKSIIKNGKHNQYRINVHGQMDDYVAGRLKSLVRKHSYQNGNYKVTKTGTSDIPFWEGISYQNSNTEKLPKQKLSRVEILEVDRSKEREKKDFTESVKDINASKVTISPYEYKPHNPTQRAALAAWRYLEPDKPENFSLYVGFVKRGLPERIFYDLALAIKDNDAIKNKGAYFNKKATAYCKRRATELEIMNG